MVRRSPKKGGRKGYPKESWWRAGMVNKDGREHARQANAGPVPHGMACAFQTFSGGERLFGEVEQRRLEGMIREGGQQWGRQGRGYRQRTAQRNDD